MAHKNSNSAMIVVACNCKQCLVNMTLHPQVLDNDPLWYVLQWWLLIGFNWMATVYPKKYAHCFVVLCFAVVMQSLIMNSHEVFIHIHQGCFAGTGAIVRLPQCQWSKPDGYGKISQCITTTKHSKAKTVCIFLGIYCILTAVQGLLPIQLYSEQYYLLQYSCIYTLLLTSSTLIKISIILQTFQMHLLKLELLLYLDTNFTWFCFYWPEF